MPRPVARFTRWEGLEQRYCFYMEGNGIILVMPRVLPAVAGKTGFTNGLVIRVLRGAPPAN